jgi:hypothetical protein
MSLYTNQFSPTAYPGQLDLQTNPNPFVLSCRYDPQDTEGNTLLAGEGVLLKDLGANDAAGLPIIGKRTGNNDIIFGAKVARTKNNTSAVGDVVEIAGEGAVIYMECSGAILRGARVALVLATPGQVMTKVDGYQEFGFALDKGSNGQLIRVRITDAGTGT